MAEQRFFELVGALCRELTGEEVLLASLGGEESAFVRFNGGRVRQPGTVASYEVELDLVCGGRHAQAACTLTGDASEDIARTRAMLRELRDVRARMQPDPWLNYETAPCEMFERRPGELVAADDAVRDVVAGAAGEDLGGILACGPVFRGFASSLGGRAWFESRTFSLDASFHSPAGKAVKLSLGGSRWDGASVRRRLDDARGRLALLDRPAYEPKPGRYRAYLAPGALEEILNLLAWGAFSIEAHRTKQTPLLAMIAEDRRLHASVTLRENFADGAAAGFTSRGFRKPDAVDLVAGGRYRDCLVDAASAKRYAVPVNAEHEFPESLQMGAGTLAAERALDELGTGLFVSDLWYTNFSDRNDCRITGMTRYASFWVENGRLAAPLAAMRFDDSLYSVLGERLAGVTAERERLFDVHTYGGRSLRSMLLPGVLVDGLRLAL